MANFSISARAFWDGFTLAGLFGRAKLPGGAETLVEEASDLSESQFAELFLPLLKPEPDRRTVQTSVRVSDDEMRRLRNRVAESGFMVEVRFVPRGKKKA
jgi:hypothetical protein